jgi:serine/threonine protein kinase
LYGGEKVLLSDYPFALVYPHCEEGDLFDYFYHQASDNLSEVSDIALQIGKALQVMHGHGLIHSGLSMRCISMLPLDSDEPSPKRKWVISDLSGVRRIHQNAILGAISSDGSAQFETGLMPPEMFTKVSPNELQLFKEYWQKVEELYGIRVDRQVVEPYVDTRSGCSYVLRCHYVPEEQQKFADGQLPDLPYRLVPERESTDLWCFGVMLYCMRSGG